MDIRPLSRAELPAPAAALARWLIGKTLVREHRRGWTRSRWRTTLERNAMRWNRARFHLIAFARIGDACCKRHDGSS
jgi:hypothetical protein